jgi:hypothetical protein
MLCSYCKAPLVADGVPCPNCGALPSLLTAPAGDVWGKTQTTESALGRNRASIFRKAPAAFEKKDSNTQLNFPEAGYNDDSQLWTPQLSFETQYAPFSQVQPVQPVEAQNQDQQQALVPYQQVPPAVGQTTMSLQLIPDQVVEQLLPAMPEIVHVSPMYTKPRPIIPRHQVISSLLSLLIVCLFICGGGVYYAHITGKLAFLHQITGNALPPSIQPKQASLPDPPNKVDMGPAYNIIPSAATALHIDPKTNFVITPVNAFSPGQQFYLAFSVISPNEDGQVSTKWYTNNQYFTTVQSKGLIKAHSNESGSVSITYPQAAEGSVELYWNGQLAQRLYFVVR